MNKKQQLCPNCWEHGRNFSILADDGRCKCCGHREIVFGQTKYIMQCGVGEEYLFESAENSVVHRRTPHAAPGWRPALFEAEGDQP